VDKEPKPSKTPAEEAIVQLSGARDDARQKGARDLAKLIDHDLLNILETNPELQKHQRHNK
jgi:hypothetical protein